jgi:hypothetical protein
VDIWCGHGWCLLSCVEVWRNGVIPMDEGVYMFDGWFRGRFEDSVLGKVDACRWSCYVSTVTSRVADYQKCGAMDRRAGRNHKSLLFQFFNFARSYIYATNI